MQTQIFFLTCKVEDLRPLLADVDTDVRTSHSQVGTTLVKHEGLHLQGGDASEQKMAERMYVATVFKVYIL